MSLSAYVRSDEAPAFNIIFRVLAPVVFIVLAASFFYSIGFDWVVQEIWFTTVFYCVLRLLFILVFDRVYLINWMKEVFIWLSSTGLTWLIYKYFIENKSNLLPEPQELKNEFWIIIILFIYSLLNRIDLDNAKTKLRKLNYLNKNYLSFKCKFGVVISRNSPDMLCESLIYAVLLCENFNRPKVIRAIEHIAFPRFAKTLGPMQVNTLKRLNDSDCIEQGSKIIARSYIDAIEYANQTLKVGEVFNPYTNRYHMKYLQYRIAANYNKDDQYVEAITEMHDQLLENVYPTFLPKQRQRSVSDWYLDEE